MPVSTTSNLQLLLQQRINNKTKPPGALGRLEEIALQVGLMQGTAEPAIHYPHIVVFAGDHGIATTGLVSAYPQEVTAQMVLNFLHGGAAINVFCRQHDIVLKVADAGVNFDWNDTITDERFIHAKIANGTANYLHGPAMSGEQALAAMEKGRQIVNEVGAAGCNCIGLGEMGIANTSSAALIMSAVTGLPIEECTGRGTGLTDGQYNIKEHTLRTVFDKHFPRGSGSTDPVEILQRVGGLEIAMMTGAYLEAAASGMVIVVDGFIASAALLLAHLLHPTVLNNCIFAHTSGERGHEKMLAHLGAKPLLNLGLRLGEGTGAALAIPLIRSAVNFLREMASFESAGISNRE